MMSKQDIIVALVIGAAVGLLLQPIISNFGPAIQNRIFLPLGVFRPIVFVVAAIGFPSVVAALSRFVPALYQFGKFASVGVLNTTIDFGVFNLLVALTGIAKGSPASLFKAISFIVATTNSFFWNKRWTFSSSQPANSEEALKFYTVAFIGWGINVAVFSLVVNSIGAPAGISDKLWANFGVLAGVASSFLWDFLGYKHLVFKKIAPRP